MLAVHVPTYRALRKCGHEELAAHQINAIPSGGILFARKASDENKTLARDAIVALLAPERFPEPISVLTMPGLKWKFEGTLLRAREGEDYRGGGPARTQLVCIENDRSIYHAAMIRMPGMRNPKHVFSVLPPMKFAERTVSGMFIDRYYFGNVDDLMQTPPQRFDAAWLDYTGPMSVERLRLIAKFWRDHVASVLIITMLRARWNKAAVEAIFRAGGHQPWLRKALPGTVLHEIEYQDGQSPMVQFAVAKESADD